LLFMLLCAPLHANECEWKYVGAYRSEEICVAAGLSLGEPLPPFRCRLHVESIPLPRPRPTR
jgi:hypothetical protein